MINTYPIIFPYILYNLHKTKYPWGDVMFKTRASVETQNLGKISEFFFLTLLWRKRKLIFWQKMGNCQRSYCLFYERQMDGNENEKDLTFLLAGPAT